MTRWHDLPVASREAVIEQLELLATRERLASGPDADLAEAYDAAAERLRAPSIEPKNGGTP